MAESIPFSTFHHGDRVGKPTGSAFQIRVRLNTHPTRWSTFFAQSYGVQPSCPLVSLPRYFWCQLVALLGSPFPVTGPVNYYILICCSCTHFSWSGNGLHSLLPHRPRPFGSPSLSQGCGHGDRAQVRPATRQSLACNKSRSLLGETICPMNGFFATVSN